jgi:hypothetical protein
MNLHKHILLSTSYFLIIMCIVVNAACILLPACSYGYMQLSCLQAPPAVYCKDKVGAVRLWCLWRLHIPYKDLPFGNQQLQFNSWVLRAVASQSVLSHLSQCAQRGVS